MPHPTSRALCCGPPLSPAGSALLVYTLSLFCSQKKKKKKKAASSHPPISPLPLRTKILKTPVNTGCLHFLISHSLFSALPSGYQPHHPLEMAWVKATTNKLQSQIQRSMLGAGFCSIPSQAHPLLLEALLSLSFPGFPSTSRTTSTQPLQF